MFWLGFVAAVAIVSLLTLVGAAMSRRNPGTDWQSREDHPMLGPGDH
jgi:hypothetical protein